MELKKIVVFSLVLCGAAFANLLNNGAFDEAITTEIFSDYTHDTFALSTHTEDRTWNKCLKVELKKITVNEKGHKRVGISICFGRDGSLPGVKVEPNAVYSFTFEAKGTAPRAATRAVTWHGDGKSIWDKSRKEEKTSLGGFTVGKDWTRYSGTFKTGPDAERAALTISLWGDSGQEANFVWEEGMYLLVDNVSVTRKKQVGAAGQQLTPPVPQNIRDVVLTPGEVEGFINVKTGAKADQGTSFALSNDGNAMVLTVKCKSTGPVKATVKENGTKIWADDVVEVFFGPSPKNDRILSQFVLGAGGGRYMGDGNSVLTAFDTWTATSQITDDGWIATYRIPFAALGYDAPPKAGESILFNISRQSAGELSSWAPVRGNFHDTEKYNLLVFGNAKDFAAFELGKIGKVPEELAGLRKEIEDAKMAPKEILTKLGELRWQIRELSLGSATYLLGTMPVTGDFSFPIDVDLDRVLLDNKKPIVLTAAVNEIAQLPLTITNRTSSLCAYRVILHPNLKMEAYETLGLEGGFPEGAITMHEAVPVKDGDNFGTGLRFDPLPKMNQIFSVVMPAGQTSVVWINFDCRGVAPETYRGAIRVVPMSEPASMEKNKYKGPAKDWKFALTVLPVTLDVDNRTMPTWLMGRGDNESFFLEQAKLGGRFLMVNPWSFKFKFDEKGNILESDLPNLVEAIKTRVAWYEKYGFKGGRRFIVGFDAYGVFEKQYLNKKIAILSPEWRNAWKNNLLAMAEIFKKAGVSSSDWCIEVIDEPNGNDIERDLEATKIVKETLPDIMTTMTWAASNYNHTPDTIRKFSPYIGGHCFWASHLNDPKYRELIKDELAAGKEMGIYSCSTSMRESLHRYFRLHAWKAWEAGMDYVGFYIFVDAPYGSAGVTNWKVANRGGLGYRSGEECLSSIRMEAFRQGMTDSAYLELLRRLAGDGKSPLQKEALEFLAKAPKEAVITKSYDPTVPDKLRAKAIELILKLQNTK